MKILLQMMKHLLLMRDSPYNNITSIVREDPESAVFINNTDKTVYKKTRAKSQVSHQIAPGEGKVCSNWMRDEDFDIDAFPKHHGDGKYGLNYPREIKLTPHAFFGQRAMNHDKRWSRDSSYMFVGQQYVERHAIERNIGISMTKGRMKKDGNTTEVTPLENSFSILKKIPGTPSYWRVFRNDILAKMEQKGNFHGFFTLSCAEKRWPEVLTAILGSEGNKITFLTMPWDGREESILINDEPLSNMKDKIKWSEELRKNVMLITQMFDNRVRAFIKNILLKCGVDLYAYRLEWQIRGMPHIHGVFWLEDKIIKHLIDIKTGSLICNDELIKLIDKWVSCSLTNDNEELNEIVKEVNCHKHTKSCKKHSKTCRFNFPRFPSNYTMFAIQPSDDDDEDEDSNEEKISSAKNILTRVKERLEDLTEEEKEFSLKEFLDTFEPAITEKEYHDALSISQKGTKIILKRSLKEIFVNNYNPNFLLVWKANMDIQFCTDIYAVVTYITDYLTKSDSGFEKLLETVLKENPGSDYKEHLNSLKRIYFKHRQICYSEAIYRLLPTLQLKKSNLKTKFVTTGFPENRSTVFLPKYDEDAEDDDNDDEQTEKSHTADPSYSIAGRKGNYRKIRTVHEKYSIRPESEIMNKMCLAFFATVYETGKKPKTKKFNGQISEDIEKCYSIEVPKWLILDDGTCMRLRKSPAVLRIHSSKKKKDYEEQYSELLLFYPWRDENKDLHPDDCEAVLSCYNDNIQTILHNRELVLPYSSLVAEMRENIEQGVDMHPTHIGDLIASTIEQEDDDDSEILEPLDDTPVIAEEDYNNSNNVEKLKFKNPVVLDDNEMLNIARSLSKEQRMAFDRYVDYVKKLVCQKKYATADFFPPMIISTGNFYSFNK